MKKNILAQRLHFHLFMLLAICSFLSAKAQIQLVKNRKPVGKIIVTKGSCIDKKAASLLKDFIYKISEADMQIELSPSKVNKGDIVIETVNDSEITEDGYKITTKDGYLHIKGGEGKGSIYGVVTLLEQYLGCNYWGDKEYSIPSLKDINLPKINVVNNPSFRYRQSNSYALKKDSIYRMWYRLEEPDEAFAANYWVHTMNQIVPYKEYEKTHPEYFAYYNGKRNPGAQLCLSNPDVVDLISNKIDSIFKANPGQNIISVSQNDGNGTHCTCDECRRLDEHEGTLSGALIHFMNKLAARFPDKELSTLAYLYTVNPPKYVKPLPNVNIMLCNIECKREVSLNENESGRSFVKALESWSKISNNIFVWDYGINFDGLITPFPNFHTMKDNINLYKKNNVTMYYSQHASTWGGDFSELRTYMVSKLMWNHKADAYSLMQTFLKGYYEESAPYLYRYLNIIEGALMGSGVPLWIYDTPVTHKNGMLKPVLMRRYNELFDEAEKAVADKPEILKRVRRTRLSLQYSELEIARTEKEKDIDDIVNKLNLFEQRCKEYNVVQLNERNNRADDYCRLYRERYLPSKTKNIAAGAKITYSVPIPERYRSLGYYALTDGLYGGSTYGDSWLGWEGCDVSFVMDMGETKAFNSLSADFLHQLGAWILLPKSVKYSISDDNMNFKTLENITIPESREGEVKFVDIKHESKTPLKARYIKVDIEGTKDCPKWHYGVGNKCWFFLDEVTVH